MFSVAVLVALLLPRDFPLPPEFSTPDEAQEICAWRLCATCVASYGPPKSAGCVVSSPWGACGVGCTAAKGGSCSASCWDM